MTGRTDTTVANEILRQLGGSKFLAMTGAKYLTAVDDRTLGFVLPKMARNRIKVVRIRLDPSDTYTLSFFQRDLSKVDEREGIYCDVLQEVFTRVTGLDTHL